MGRNFSRKPVKDTETASETMIHGELGSSTLKKMSEVSPVMPISASLQSSPPFDDFSDKKT